METCHKNRDSPGKDPELLYCICWKKTENRAYFMGACRTLGEFLQVML